jgi:hypothetical protein
MKPHQYRVWSHVASAGDMMNRRKYMIKNLAEGGQTRE